MNDALFSGLELVIADARRSMEAPRNRTVSAPPSPSPTSTPTVGGPSRTPAWTKAGHLNAASTFLLGLVSSVMPYSVSSDPVPFSDPARSYKRLARSRLLDLYRRHVVPEIKSRIGPTFLNYAVSRTAAKIQSEEASLRAQMRDLLSGTAASPLAAAQSAWTASLHSTNSSTLSLTSFDSSSSINTVSTAATSIALLTIDSPSSSIRQYLLSLPRVSEISFLLRPRYREVFDELVSLASQLDELRTLTESESFQFLESGPSAHQTRSIIHSTSMAEGLARHPASVRRWYATQPVRRSSLWRSHLPADEPETLFTHPAFDAHDVPLSPLLPTVRLPRDLVLRRFSRAEHVGDDWAIDDEADEDETPSYPSSSAFGIRIETVVDPSGSADDTDPDTDTDADADVPMLSPSGSSDTSPILHTPDLPDLDTLEPFESDHIVGSDADADETGVFEVGLEPALVNRRRSSCFDRVSMLKSPEGVEGPGTLMMSA